MNLKRPHILAFNLLCLFTCSLHAEGKRTDELDIRAVLTELRELPEQIFELKFKESNPPSTVARNVSLTIGLDWFSLT